MNEKDRKDLAELTDELEQQRMTVRELLDVIRGEREDREGMTQVLRAKDAHMADLRSIIFEFGWVELQRGAPIKLVEEGE